MPKAKRRTRRIAAPRIEEHLPTIESNAWSGRKNITLWLKKSVIDACRPHPATKLREWIEENFPQGK